MYQQPPMGYPPQQPGYPQQQPGGYAPPPYGAPPAPAPGYPPQQQGYQPQQQAWGAPQGAMPPAAMPQAAVTDDMAMTEHYQANANFQGGRDGPKPNYVKWLGPQGQLKWQGVHAGFESRQRLFVCPSWQQGKPFFVKQASHFMVVNGKEMGVNCPGDGCPICMAVQNGLNHQDPNVQKKAHRYRTRYNYLYNVFMLDYPQAHVGEDGIMRPYIWSAGNNIHKKFNAVAKGRSADGQVAAYSLFTNFAGGRTLTVVKRKTGFEDMNVEYDLFDNDPIALPQQFWNAVPNLWDLEAEAAAPDFNQLMDILSKSPIAFLASGQAHTAYQPGPMPPAANPYGQPQAMPQYGQPGPAQSPYGPPAASPYGPPAASPYGPPAQAPYGAPAPGPYGAPASAQPYGAPVQQPMFPPQGAPAPAQHYGQPVQSAPPVPRSAPPPPMGAMPPAGPAPMQSQPPPMAPPQMSSQPAYGGPAPTYQAQPSQPSQPPQAPQGQQQAPAPSAPPPGPPMGAQGPQQPMQQPAPQAWQPPPGPPPGVPGGVDIPFDQGSAARGESKASLENQLAGL